MPITVAIRSLPLDCTDGDLRFAIMPKAQYFTCNFHIGPLVNMPNPFGHKARSTTITVSGAKKESFIESIHGLPVSSDTSEGKIEVDERFYGLTTIAENEFHDFDVYLLHGLGGHAFNSWATDPINHDPSTVKCWPRDFLPEAFDSAGLSAKFSTIGYNADVIRNVDVTATIKTAAEDLMSRLLSVRPLGSEASRKPMYFVCHSLGGVVLCQLLILYLSDNTNYLRLAQNYRSALVSETGECSLKGIVFLGTPFTGSLKANQISPFINGLARMNPRPMNRNLIDELKYIKDGSGDLSAVSRAAKIVMNKYNIGVLVGCETQPVSGTGRKLITERDSATGIFGDRIVPMKINGTHVDMCKFSTRNQDYQDLESRLIDMIRKTIRPATPSAETTDPRRHDNESEMDPSRPSGPGRASTMPAAVSGQSQNVEFHVHFPDMYSPNPQLPRVSANTSGKAQSKTLNERTSLNAAEKNSSSIDELVLAQHANRLSLNPSPSEEDITRRQYNDGSDFSRLASFDTVFIIDDTSSMQAPADSNNESRFSPDPVQTRWDLLEDSFRHVAGKAIEYDKDGVDVIFLKCEDLSESNIDDSNRLWSKLEEVRSLLSTQQCEGGTFYYDALQRAIEPRMSKYEEYLDFRRQRRNPLVPKKLNLILVTDGVADDEDEVQEYILSIAERLNELGAPKTYIGIQFVQIGDDPDASKWLQWLDDDLAKDPRVKGRDMVDTTPYYNKRKAEFTQKEFKDLLIKVCLGAVRRDLDKKTNQRPRPGAHPLAMSEEPESHYSYGPN